jgi:hypothetical protein
MTPKEKAKELIDSMYNTPHCDIEHFPSKHYCDCSEINFFQAKQCALIAVDEIIELIEKSYYDENIIKGAKLYWNEVKQEIEKL